MTGNRVSTVSESRFPLHRTQGVIRAGIFIFAIFGCICVRHNYFCTNVMLDVMKYRIYNCELTDANDVPVKYKVISKRYLRTQAGEGILLKQLNNDYCLDVGNCRSSTSDL